MKLADGALIEVRSEKDGRSLEVLKDWTPELGKIKLEDLADFSTSYIQKFAQRIEDGLAMKKPYEIELVVSLGVTAETGVPFIAKGSGNGNIEVHLKWKVT